jgi:tetratricopeptide (TPR) repeat protein
MEASIEHSRLASRNSPYCSLFRTYLGRAYHYAGRNREALTILDEVTVGDPTFALGHMYTALVHSELGQHDQAVHFGDRAVKLSETSATVSRNAYVLARAGRQEDAERTFDRLITAPPHGYVSPLQLGAVAEALNRREEAAGHLARARRENAWGCIWTNVEPRMKHIHSSM